METTTSQWRNKAYFIGLILVPVSLFFFLLPFFTNVSGPDKSGLFIPCFVISLIYFIGTWASGQLRKGRNGIYPIFVFLVLSLISAFELNREIVIFNESVDWFSILLIGLCVNYVSLYFFHSFPSWLQHVSVFITGISLAVFIYLALYLSPVYFIGIFAAVFFGISLHVFIPLLFLIYSIVFIRRVGRTNRRLLFTASGGAVLSLVFALVYVLQWSSTVETINKTYRQATAAENDGLPAWVYVAQKVPQNQLTEKVLKTGLVYTVPNGMDDIFSFRMPGRNFGESKKHDPLVTVATLFGGRPNLDEDTQIKILEAQFDARHQAQRRLWDGDDLSTEQVVTSIDMWPQFGLSYTEKKITVSNIAQKQTRWVDQQEAIYTFHLPEGAVVTALSLWIDGMEAKGILTTKQKAAEAYNTIVGREKRDPSVVHWQEGNTVSVRVFPVIAGESRVFKLGVTAPLSRGGFYENIDFEGPDAGKAIEEITIHFKDNPTDFIIPASFSVNGKHSFSLQRKYTPNWKLKVTEQPLSQNAFCFDGKVYTIRPKEEKYESFEIKNVYLDINNSWSWETFDRVYKAGREKNLFVYNGRMVQLNDSNKDELFYELQKQQFSIFPFFYITDKSNSVVVTKNSGLAPNISDLKDSRFLDQLKKFLSDSSSKILLFDLGDELSPYLKTLKEYRVFKYQKGFSQDAQLAMQGRQFPVEMENDNQVVIDQSNIIIQQTDGAIPSAAPDHLMRLFSYNHIMQKMGTRLLTDTTVDESLIDEAAKAYVVSPVSSLVVLETQKDYDRFDIKDKDNSLKNASHKSSGAVPEPHEWALIIIAVLTLLYAKFYHRKKRMA